VRGTLVALRQEQAREVLVRPITDDAAGAEPIAKKEQAR
jgi:hypothetical protein